MSIAKSYARALFEAAKESKSSPQDLDQLENQMDSVLGVLSTSKEMQIVLLGAATSAKEKVAVLNEIAKKANLALLMRQFLFLLGRKQRLKFLPEIREAFGRARLEAEGGVLGKLVSADPIEAKDVEDLARAFGKKLGKQVAFSTSIDPSLLAGIKITVSGVTYDGTLKSQVQRLRERLIYGTSAAH